MRLWGISLISRQTQLACVLGSLVAVSCAAVRNPALERAHEAYQQARQDPLIVKKAGAALERAEQALRAADRLWAEEHDVAEVEHLAYITEKRVEIARVTAQRRLIADEIERSRSARQ